MAKRLLIALLVLVFLLPAFLFADENAHTFVVEKEGKTIGFLDFHDLGEGNYEEAERDWEGVVRLQEKFDSGSYTASFLLGKTMAYITAKSGPKGIHLEKKMGDKVESKSFSLGKTPVFFAGITPAPLLALQGKFPKKAGDVVSFAAIDPTSLALVQGMIENEGERVFLYQGRTIKTEYFVAGIGDSGVVLYQDDNGKIFLMEMPLQGMAWHLQEYDPDSLPITAKDTLPSPPLSNFGAREVAISGASKTLLQGELLIPAGSGPFPAAVLLADKGNLDRDGNPIGDSLVRPNALKDLAEFLAEHGVATLRYDKPAGASAGDLVKDAFHASLWLRGQKEVDPNRVFLIGLGEGAQVGFEEAIEDSETAGLVLLSPGSALLSETSTAASLKKLGIPVSIFMGGADLPSRLSSAQSLSQQADGAGSASISLIVVPDLDDALMKPTHLQGGAAYLDPERKISDSALDGLLTWLLNHGL